MTLHRGGRLRPDGFPVIGPGTKNKLELQGRQGESAHIHIVWSVINSRYGHKSSCRWQCGESTSREIELQKALKDDQFALPLMSVPTIEVVKCE